MLFTLAKVRRHIKTSAADSFILLCVDESEYSQKEKF